MERGVRTPVDLDSRVCEFLSLCRMLIAEDNEMNRGMLSRRLSRHGMTGNREQALEAVASKPSAGD